MNTCPVNSDDNLIPSAKQPCIECPFRTTNADIPAPQDWYTQDNFERIWASVARENQSFPCHMFDRPEATGYDGRSRDAGLREPVDLGKPKECAGMTGMIHREIRIASGYPDWETYIAARPTGLQREAYETALARMAGTGTPLTEPADPDSAVLLDPAQRVDTESLAWKLGESGNVALLSATQQLLDALNIAPPPCDCRVCNGHTTAHDSRELLTATGETVNVDTELHTLLEVMNVAGIRTTGSCKDLRGAMEQLWPEQVQVLLAEDHPHTISYAVTLRRREAVIRFENRNDAERQFIKSLRFTEGLHIANGPTQTQLTFPLHMIPVLAILAGRAR
ncbi:hypothetical protein [Pseudarthrobacter sp. MDT3-1]